MASRRVAAVTGANKGIGLAIVRQLALQYPKSALNDRPLLIYLTARDRARGEAAVQQLHSDSQLKQAKALVQDGGLSNVKFRQLDIADSASIDEFCEFLKNEHPDGVDVLVNNAGVAMDGFDANVVKQTLQINYYGTLQMTQGMLPLLKPAPTSRIVNVSSAVGKLNKYSSATTSAFRSATAVSQITKLMQDFQSAVSNGTHKQQRWPNSAYAVSKAGVTGVTGVVAAEYRKSGGKGLVNACCPGYVQTDMTKGGGMKTPDQGAATPVYLALGDLEGKSGLFWEHEEVSWW